MKTRHLSIVVKQQSKYLCWDSFAAEWFWGPKRLSEKFPWDSNKCIKANELAKRYGGMVVFVAEKNEDEATIIQTTR